VPLLRPRASPLLAMLATFGELLAQANLTLVSVLPFESWAVAENDSCWLGEMDDFRGAMLMVAGGPVVADEELPPQLAREMLMASKHISVAARRVVLRVRLVRMILEADLAVAQVQKRGIRWLSAFNPACLCKLLTARRADKHYMRTQRLTEKSAADAEFTARSSGDVKLFVNVVCADQFAQQLCPTPGVWKRRTSG
jgi:hypothetical protein